jgi:hypothetical protein
MAEIFHLTLGEVALALLPIKLLLS